MLLQVGLPLIYRALLVLLILLTVHLLLTLIFQPHRLLLLQVRLPLVYRTLLILLIL